MYDNAFDHHSKAIPLLLLIGSNIIIIIMYTSLAVLKHQMSHSNHALSVCSQAVPWSTTAVSIKYKYP